MFFLFHNTAIPFPSPPVIPFFHMWLLICKPFLFSEMSRGPNRDLMLTVFNPRQVPKHIYFSILVL
uniref:Uncharacterized protein n=1 Tax=Anguilla anguilla TaxID=7936 RepID=A0A0E9SIG4_ANGAN